jgi:hypothetical protein
VVLYVLIALVAVAPGMVAEIGVLALPLRVEAVLLTMLVFLGVNVAWLLLFDQTPPPIRPWGSHTTPWAMTRRHRGCAAVQPARHPADHPAPSASFLASSWWWGEVPGQ